MGMPNQDIARMFKGKNFMTDEVIRYGSAGKYYYELSTGKCIFDRDKSIFGITVKSKQGHQTKSNPDLSKCFDSLKLAEEYIGLLRKYSNGDYMCAVPPASTENWEDFDWMKFIFGNTKSIQAVGF